VADAIEGAMSRSSLGVVLVALGTPRARRDIRLCGFSPTASLDEVCRTLAATGMYSEESLRINAMRVLGRLIARRFKSAAEAARHLAKLHRRLGVWAAASCARESLHIVSNGETLPRVAIETAEAWVAGLATAEQADESGYAANTDAFYSDTATAAANCAAAWAASAVTSKATAAAAKSAARRAAHARASDKEAVDGSRWQMANRAELRRLVSVIVDRLVLFPEWQGDPAEDLWPMPTRKR